MSGDKIELILNNVLLALQLCLGLYQFIKLTPVGALIQGVIGWLLRPLGISPAFSLLQHCPGRVFKRANCFALQADIPSDRRDIRNPEVHLIELRYLDRDFRLERVDGNMLFINDKMCYYITDTIWEELQNMKEVLHYSLVGPPIARQAVTGAAAKRARAESDAAVAREAVSRAAANRARAESDAAAEDADAAVEAADDAAAGVKYYARFAAKTMAAKAAAAAAAAAAIAETRPAAAATAAAAADASAAAAAEARAAADAEAARKLDTVFVKGNKPFWAEMTTGGVMTLDEVFDALILYNQHVGLRLNNVWLLPINLSVSEEKLLKILNLFALFLQTKKVVKVHWLIPTLLSLTSALLEISTRGRVWLYNHINFYFCYMMHLICDPFPRPWRRQVYSLGKWVENLTPCNDIQAKVVRGDISAIFTEGAKVDKVDKEGAIRCNMCSRITKGSNVDKERAILVPLLNMAFKPSFGVIEEQFSCESIMITCIYIIEHHLCEISAPKISVFYVKCEDEDHFRHIITLALCIAESSCGSLISYDPNNKKVRVRGFEESLTLYVNSGFKSIYKLELKNVVVA